jgi:replicative DNA helicase
MNAILHAIDPSMPKKNTQSPLSELPNHEAAEQNLLGVLLLDNQSLETIGDFLKSEHFHIALHGLLFKTIASMCDEGSVADPITIHAALKDHPLYAKSPQQGYLVQLVEGVFQVGAVQDHARLIYDSYMRRKIIAIGRLMVNQAHVNTQEKDAKKQIEEAEKQLYDLATHGEMSTGFQSFETVLSKAMAFAENAHKRKGHLVGVSTGLIELDKKLGGLHPSDLLILAGRPSMGKTALATNIAFNAAKRFLCNQEEGGRVAFFSLEMSSDQLASRILASEACVSSDGLRRGQLTYEQFNKILETSRIIKESPLYIDDTAALSITALRNRCRRLKRQQGLELVVVDYLQLLTHSEGNRFDGRVQEISEITRGLKALAKELNVPVIALSQLSRAVEQRDNKRPQLSDLRESGSIEQDADVVMFVYREAYYMERTEPADKSSSQYDEWQKKSGSVYNKAEVILAKQRHGPIGKVDLYFDAKFTKFGNLMPSS